MQTHDDQTCPTVAGDFGNLFRRFTVNNQGFRRGPLSGIVGELLELRLRPVTALSFDGRKRRM